MTFDDVARLVYDRVDHVRLNADAPVRENRVGGSHFHESTADRPEGEARHGLQRRFLDSELAGVAHDVRKSILDSSQHRREVHGAVQRTPHRHHAFEFLFEIRRTPSLGRIAFVFDRHRLVVNRVAGGSSGFDSGRIDDRLKGRTRLAKGLHGAVPAGFSKTVAADHGADRTGSVFDQDHRHLGSMVTQGIREAPFGRVGCGILSEIVFFEKRVNTVEMGDDRIGGHVVLGGQAELPYGTLLHALADAGNVLGFGRFGKGLDLRIDRAVNVHAICVQGFLAVLVLHELADFFVIIKARTVADLMLVGFDRFFDVTLVVFLGDVPCGLHGVKNRVATF